MPKTNAQRQADYRQRTRTRKEGYTARLNTEVLYEASYHLKLLAAYHGLTQKQMLEKLIRDAHQATLMTLDDEQTDLYLDKKLSVTQ